MIKNSTYGLIPIGGKGTRLALQYSKEMIPQKNFDYYNPVVNHIVEKMELAGAEKIIFVHGSEFKEDIKQYFKDEKYIHILQKTIGFANVILDFYDQINPMDEDVILFGLPDSIFNKNPFVEMVIHDGIVCGLFTTDKQSKVDRLNKEGKNFQIKTSKNEDNQDWFWGVLKFNGRNIKRMIQDDIFKKYSEIGLILNSYEKSIIYGESYLDLGTWINYNRYLSDPNSFSNVEIEKKYDASDVSVEDFVNFFSDQNSTYQDITSTDFYYIADNSNIEFIRYREKSKDIGSISDLTIKNFNKSQLNRFELTLPLSNKVESHNVMHFLNILGLKFKFNIVKRCRIFKFEDYTIVYYNFNIKDKDFKIIEIELHKIDFNLISNLENKMSALNGFDPSKIITKSKFQIINEELHDTTH
jgi:hypothetical protein